MWRGKFAYTRDYVVRIENIIYVMIRACLRARVSVCV